MKRRDSGGELVLAAAAIALSLSRGLTVSEINVLAGLTGAVSENLSVIAARRQACEPEDLVLTKS